MNKGRYVIITIAIVSVIIAGAVLVLFNIRKADTKKGAEVLENSVKNEEINKIEYRADTNLIVETNGKETERITPNTTIVFNKYYKQCNHLIKRKEDVTAEMVNLTEDEFKSLYQDWKIQQFNSNEIIMYKEFDDECGEHYVVREDNDLISIYRRESNEKLALIEETDISTKYLPQIDRDKLKKGVELNGKEELNAYIEDFE